MDVHQRIISHPSEIALHGDSESTSEPFTGRSAPLYDSHSLRISETSQVGETNDSSQNAIDGNSAKPWQYCGEYHIYQPMDIDIPEENERDEFFCSRIRGD